MIRPDMRRHRLLAVAAALLTCLPAAAAAQWQPYLLPGTLGEEREPTERELARAAADAPWSFLGIRLQPWAGISSATYSDNVFATADPKTSDTTASLGAGLRAFLPVGEDILIGGYVQPEYVWWQDLSDQRRTNARSGVALFGFFDRLELRLAARQDERQRIVTPELDRAVHVREERGRARVLVDLGERAELFGSADLVRLRHLDDEDFHPAFRVFDVLDREETVLRGGVRFQLGQRWRLGVGAEYAEAEFEPGARNLSNRGSSGLFEIGFRGRTIHIDGEWVRHEIDPRPGSDFVPFDTSTGHGILTWRSHPHRAYQVYLSRRLGYSLEEAHPYFEDRRIGGAVLVEVGRETELKLFVEDGSHEYTPFDPEVDARSDDVRTWGGRLTGSAGPKQHWFLAVARTRVASDVPELDRSTLRATLGWTFGGPELPW